MPQRSKNSQEKMKKQVIQVCDLSHGVPRGVLTSITDESPSPGEVRGEAFKVKRMGVGAEGGQGAVVGDEQ